MTLRNITRCLGSLTKQFHRRTPWNSARTTVIGCRQFGTEPGNVELSIDQSSGIAVLKMNKKPVNSLNLEFLTELTISLEKLDNISNVNGLVITSGLPKIFSAGLDILEMYQPKKDRLVEFWRTLQTFWLKLYSLRLATAAAITGHSPAGGCLIALSCDYRVMADGNFTIGLNETRLGMVAPFWFMSSLVNVVGHRQSERALQLGSLFTPADALRIGLVDEVVPESEVVDRAKQEVVRLLKVPGAARQLTKEVMRKSSIDALLARVEPDVENFVKSVEKDSFQRTVGAYLESLKKKK